ncbi:hypothetical protein J3R73_005488 [Labrys monachus]|jgi:hypothetical protein|uniref:Uncharacterized protein n=1 Tax=Labrys monachus TaxID=217067 RepID=A0ABU0FM75_9HYPH|nr:hypothetical protein [Labrys monachus]
MSRGEAVSGHRADAGSFLGSDGIEGRFSGPTPALPGTFH